MLAIFMLLPSLSAWAQISGSVAATGWRNGAPVVSAPASLRIGLEGHAPALSLEIRSHSPAFSRPGEVVQLAASLFNAGNVTLVRPILEAGAPVTDITCPDGKLLAPGESLVCEVMAMVGAAEIDAGSMAVAVTAMAIDPMGGLVGPAEGNVEIAATRADLITIASFEAGQLRPGTGDRVMFRVEIVNQGPDVATGIEATISLPDGLSFLPEAGLDGFDPATGIWKIGSLEPHAHAALALAATVNPGMAGRTLAGRAEIARLDQVDGRMEGDQNDATITIASALLVTRRSIEASGPVRHGEPVTLVTHIRNEGPDRARQITVQETLPPGIALRSESASEGRFDPAHRVWTLESLEPGGEARLRLELDIGAELAGSRVTVGAKAATSMDDPGRTSADNILAAMFDVEWPVLTALDDAADGIDGLQGPAPILNVLDNDRLDDRPVDPARLVVAALTRDTPLSLDPDGTLRLAASTPAGAHELAYRICLAELPQICSDATAHVEIGALPLSAADDEATEPADGTSGSHHILDVLANDRRGDRPVNPDLIQLTELAQGPGAYLQLEESGHISVPAGTPAGGYWLDYRICDRIDPENCAVARARIGVDAPASITGTAYRDINGSGDFEPGSDQGEAALEVELLSADGDRIARTITAADGRYRLAPLPGATGYRLVFRRAGGSILGAIPHLDILPGQVLADLDFATDPTGVVYNAITRHPVQGARLTLTDADGTPLPQACLADPQMQGQVTGADGTYRLSLIAGAHPACPAADSSYRIRLVPPEGYAPYPSSILPPMADEAELAVCGFDPVPGGRCQLSARASAPLVGDPVLHAIGFLAGAGDLLPLHNHIPLDPLPRNDRLDLSLVAQPDEIGRGGRLVVEISSRNGSATEYRGTSLVNIVPPGFLYVEGSARLDGKPVIPARGGDNLVFRDLDLGAGTTMTLRLALEAERALVPGRYVYRARLVDGAGSPLAPELAAPVTLLAEEAQRCSDIVGHVRHAGDGTGIAGVRIRLEGRHAVTTDRAGRYRFACEEISGGTPGATIRLFPDLESLPPETRLEGELPRIVQLSAEETVTVDFSAITLRIIRLDISGAAFEGTSATLDARWLEGIERLVTLLEDEVSILRISYRAGTDRPERVRERIDAVSQLVRDRWQVAGNPYPLEIRSEIAD